PIAKLLQELPVKAAVLDGEVVAINGNGSPIFARLHVRWHRPGGIHRWAFDRRHSMAATQPRSSVGPCRALLERFACQTVVAGPVLGLAWLTRADANRELAPVAGSA